MALSTTQYGYIIDPMVPFTDGKGKTIKDGFVRVFVAGSSTPVITYRNFDGAANQDLIELDNSGRTKTSVIGSKGLTYKVCVYDKHHSQESPILTVDKVSVIGANITAGAGATVVTGLDGLTTKPNGFVDASVVGTDGYVALDHTLVTDDLDTDAKVTAVEDDRYIALLNKDVNDPDSKMTLGRLWQWTLGKIKSLSTTITAFRTGDVIPVDGPSGTAKMLKDDLLNVTAQNPIAGWWNFAKTITTSNALAMDKNLVQGERYLVYRGSHDITKVSFLEEGFVNAQEVSFGDKDFVIFTADSAKKYILATSPNSQYGDVIVGKSALIISAIKKMQSDLSALSSSMSESVSRINTILGSWNFAGDITSKSSFGLTTDLNNGKNYLVWRSANNITKVSFLDWHNQNAQDVTFGDDDFKIFTANGDKHYLYPTSSDYSYGYVLVADISIIRSVFELANDLKSRIAQVESEVFAISKEDIVFDRVCPATETYNTYFLGFRAGVEYVVETDPTKVSKLIFMTSGFLHAVTINITTSQTKFSFGEDKGIMWVYSSSDASVVIRDLSVVTPFTNRFLINEVSPEEVYHVGPTRVVTSFTQMLQNLQGNTNKKVIYVDAGVYDIFEEIGGAAFARDITGIADDWRDNSVIVPDNTRIVGLGDVTFNFLPADADISNIGAQQLSPLNIENNVEVENITINADNCRYCIHSEMSSLAQNVDKHQKYKNVILNKMHTNKGWNQAFGCGFYKRAKFDFEGCVFTSWNQPISMHDAGLSANDGATINIKDCVFSTTNQNEVYALNFAEMSGAQTHHHVLLSNSRFSQPIRINRSLEYVTHNSFDVRAIGCGNITFSVSDLFEDNIYPPQDYS